MSNTPDIRFKGFTEPWEQRKLGEIAELTSSKRIHAEDYVDNGVPFYRGKEISELREHKPVSEVLYIAEEKYNEISKLYGSPAQGDLLITAVGTLGNTWVVDRLPFYFKDGNLIWFKNIKCDAKFLEYVLSTPEGQQNIDSSAIGSNQKALTIVKLKELNFMFPDIIEQQQMVNYFDDLDKLIVLHQHKCDEMSELKKFMLQKIFPKNGERFPEIRFNGFTAPWEQRKLGEIANKVTEKNTNLEYKETLTNSAEFGIISQRDFFDHDVSNAENIGGYYIVRDEDFVYNPRISTMAPVGPINRNKLGRNGVMSPLYTVFRIHDVDNSFLEQYFKSSYWHSYMYFNGDSGARSDRFSIKDELFFQMPLATPSLSEQKKIGEYLTSLDKLLTLHQRKCDELKEFKKFMLQNMFPKKG